MKGNAKDVIALLRLTIDVYKEMLMTNDAGSL
jgi:hypothetical protein